LNRSSNVNTDGPQTAPHLHPQFVPVAGGDDVEAFARETGNVDDLVLGRAKLRQRALFGHRQQVVEDGSDRVTAELSAGQLD
jgi:hypothetical protein